MRDTHIKEQQYRTSRSIACQGVPWWLSATTAIEAEPLEKQAETVEAEPESIDGDNEGFPGVLFPAGGVSDATNEFYWANLSDRDRDYLLGPRNYPAPCPWCGGRLRHNRLCDALRASWGPLLPFGKHKGKPLPTVPRGYLEWLAGCADGIGGDLRDAIKFQLERGRDD